MLPSFVCYADILGYKQMSREALSSGKGDAFLAKLHKALSTAYERMRNRDQGFIVSLTDTPLYAVKVFTDNIVVGYPVIDKKNSQGEPELGHIFSIFAEFQAGLASEGFFIRGGIAFGKHYMDDDIAYGDALLKAVALDKDGGPPRIVLDSTALELVKRQLGFYVDIESAPHYEELLEDVDGTIFLNYLEQAFVGFPECGVFLDLIKSHQTAVSKGLEEYKGDAGVRAKYEWVARYHNFVCLDFADRHPEPTNPDADELTALACVEAQKLRDCVIDIESFAPSPRRITISPF